MFLYPKIEPFEFHIKHTECKDNWKKEAEDLKMGDFNNERKI